MNWHIGQRIVAVKDHSQGLIKKGQIFTIHGLRLSLCECHHTQINVGIFDDSYSCTLCAICDKESKHDGICWFKESMFAPIDELSYYTADELIEEIETPVLILNG